MIVILAHDASTARPVHAVTAKANRRGRRPVLLLASSTLLLPLVAMPEVASAKTVRKVRYSTSSAAAEKKAVPAAALVSLAKARRLMATQPLTAETATKVETRLRRAIALAPEWLEANRTLARWQSTRRQWSAAAGTWQDVLALRPTDREAQDELQNALRSSLALTGPTSPLQSSSLVSLGQNLNGTFDEALWNNPSSSSLISPFVSPFAASFAFSESLPRPSLVSLAAKRPLVKQGKGSVEKPKSEPAIPVPFPTASPAIEPAQIKASHLPSPDEISAALGVLKANETSVAASPSALPTGIPIVPGVTTIIVNEEDAIPTASSLPNSPDVEAPPLPDAPARVPVEARVALARARQLAANTETLPIAETWAWSELQRALKLAPQWAEVQREVALWHEAREQWGDAATHWEKVVEIAPNDYKARIALQSALSRAEANTLWSNRSLVTLGHDSANPIARGPLFTMQSLAVARPDDIKVEANGKTLLAQAPSGTPGTTSPTDTATSGPTAPIAPVAPAPAAPEASVPTLQPVEPGTPTTPQGTPNQTIDIGAPLPAPGDTGAGTPANGTPSTGSPPVNVQTVLPGASSLPPSRAAKPAVKPVRKPAAKPVRKPVVSKRTKKKPVKKVATSRGSSKVRQAAAWPWVNRAGQAMKAKDFNAALGHYQKAYALNPKNSYALLGIPDALLILKRYPEAVTAYKRFLAAYPGHPKGMHGLADAYAFSGQYAEAARVNGEILAKNPRDFAAALQAAQVLAWSKNYEESARFYRMALAVQPNNATVWTEYAETLSYTKDQRAREAFGRALQIEPQSQRARLGLANLLSWSGEYASAIPFYRDILAADPTNVKVQTSLADALTFSNQSAAAVPEYEKVLKLDPTSSEARLGLGRALTLSRRYEEGIAQLAPLVKEQPNNTEALAMLGIAQMTNQPGAALGTFQDLLKLQDQPTARAATLANIGELQVKLGQLPEARISYDEALRLAPTDNKIGLSYARALLRQQAYNETEPVLAGVLARDPANQSALLLQATVAARSGQQERAAALIEPLLAMPLEVSDDALNLFYALRGAGAAPAANRLLAKLSEANNATPENLVRVANAVRDTGQEEASYDLYKRALEASPENVEARLALAEAYLRRREFDAAAREADYVLTRQPGNVEAQVLKATVAYRRNNTDATSENANIVAKAALDANPQNVPARLLVAEVASTRAQFAQAVENYRTVVDANPENLQARLGLARNLYYLKQVDDSIKEYLALIQRAPDDTTVKLELAQVYLDRNLLDDAQKWFVEVLKASNYPLPEGTVQLARRVPGSGEIVSDSTRNALRDFAAKQQKSGSQKVGG